MAITSGSSRYLFLSNIRAIISRGDGCRRDADGYYWITGRVDDVLNVSGHRLGTAEIESALVAHPKVSEAAVVGFPHDVKGQGIYCYVTLMAGDDGVAMNSRPNCAIGCARKSGRLPAPITSNSPRGYQRRVRARSCGEFCARSQRTIMERWAIPRRWPIQGVVDDLIANRQKSVSGESATFSFSERKLADHVKCSECEMHANCPGIKSCLNSESRIGAIVQPGTQCLNLVWEQQEWSSR